MHVLDHLFVIFLLVGVPLYEYLYGVPTMRREIAADKPGTRKRMYWQMLGIQWLITALLLVTWVLLGRTLPDLGLGAPAGWGFWAALGLVVAGAALLTTSQNLQIRTPERRAGAYRQFQKVAPFMPRTTHELRHFSALSVTAGICEEIVYRGFLIWYAMQFTGSTGWGLVLAVVLPALLFGLAHLYQGVSGMVQVFGAGVFFGLAYVLAGSLWPAMILHTYMDIYGGFLTRRLHRDQHPPENDDAVSAEPVAAS